MIGEHTASTSVFFASYFSAGRSCRGGRGEDCSDEMSAQAAAGWTGEARSDASKHGAAAGAAERRQQRVPIDAERRRALTWLVAIQLSAASTSLLILSRSAGASLAATFWYPTECFRLQTRVRVGQV